MANVNSVKFSPDGSWIASAGTEGSVIIWDIRMSKVRVLKNPSFNIFNRKISFSATD